MCLAVFALAAHPDYAAVIVANRDEFHARPAAPAHWWDEGWLAGRDLDAGGTWLGVDRRGRWALLTNIREPARHRPGAPSRGALVPRVLASHVHAAAAIPEVVAGAADHNGYNLVGGDLDRAAWGASRGPQSRALQPGVHGLSNHLLDTPWPKLVRLRRAVADWCEAAPRAAQQDDFEPLFAALGDRTQAPDADLPDTGIALDRERALSAAFIVGPTYGTRCSTVVALRRDGTARFVERRFDPSGDLAGVVDQAFVLQPG